MYRTVLCFRYLMSRFLTLVATGGVFLGVGALVVTVAVMSGFVKGAREACRGGLADVIVDSDITGFPHYDELADEIEKHPNVAATTPVVHLFGMVRITPDPATGYDTDSVVSRPCALYGVRPAEFAKVGKFSAYLQQQAGAERPSFEVPRWVAERVELRGDRVRAGCVPGIELVSYHPPKHVGSAERKEPDSVVLAGRGAKLVVTTFPISATGTLAHGVGGAIRPTMRAFTVVDHYKSRLWEFDNRHMFVPFEEAQKLGELGDPEGSDPANPPRAHQIRVRLHDYDEAAQTVADLKGLVDRFRARHPRLLRKLLSVLTWEERQVTILSTVEMQRALMIILLGLVVVVAGFLIGAILVMIVKEKTRDIGILKSLGAPSHGVAQIFIYYGGTVGVVGALLGLAGGKIFLHYIDRIEVWVSDLLGVSVFPREVYYFEEIPVYEDPAYIAVIVVGAIAWAVLCSTVAAYRAARVQPVEALRYE